MTKKVQKSIRNVCDCKFTQQVCYRLWVPVWLQSDWEHNDTIRFGGVWHCSGRLETR